MAVGIPPPANKRGMVTRNALFYKSLGEELFVMTRRLTQIAGELQNVGAVIESKGDD